MIRIRRDNLSGAETMHATGIYLTPNEVIIIEEINKLELKVKSMITFYELILEKLRKNEL